QTAESVNSNSENLIKISEDLIQKIKLFKI
ncbi:MAG: hypothetical protein PWP28_844, partial [Oceanotoga sp.]|nr:hypothetical protein [Oceanotoga sp.]MDN5341969.1 hypothetical protein [Oceanotoga sp.]